MYWFFNMLGFRSCWKGLQRALFLRIIADLVGPGTHHSEEETEVVLTRPVAAVKFDLSSTPEQAACTMKIDEGLHLDVLEQW